MRAKQIGTGYSLASFSNYVLLIFDYKEWHSTSVRELQSPSARSVWLISHFCDTSVLFTYNKSTGKILLSGVLQVVAKVNLSICTRSLLTIFQCKMVRSNCHDFTIPWKFECNKNYILTLFINMLRQMSCLLKQNPVRDPTYYIQNVWMIASRNSLTRIALVKTLANIIKYSLLLKTQTCFKDNMDFFINMHAAARVGEQRKRPNKCPFSGRIRVRFCFRYPTALKSITFYEF